MVVYIVPLSNCIFGWRGAKERRAVLSKAFPRMYRIGTNPWL
jgi:hypothetical protein